MGLCTWDLYNFVNQCHPINSIKRWQEEGKKKWAESEKEVYALGWLHCAPQLFPPLQTPGLAFARASHSRARGWPAPATVMAPWGWREGSTASSLPDLPFMWQQSYQWHVQVGEVQDSLGDRKFHYAFGITFLSASFFPTFEFTIENPRGVFSQLVKQTPEFSEE